MVDVFLILLGWLFFGGTHIGMSSGRVRPVLLERLDDGPFKGLYSLIALSAFAFLITVYYVTFPAGAPLLAWGGDSWPMARLGEIVVTLSFIMLACGLLNRRPKATEATEASGEERPVAYGMTRITRHPMNMAFALFALGHLLTNRFSGDWIFFGGFILFGFLSAIHQDRKLLGLRPERQGPLQESTSILPFRAIVDGRQPLRLGELNKLGIAAGIAVAIGLRLLHS